MPVREELHRITMGLPKKKSNNHHQRQGHRQRRPGTVNSLCVVIHIHIQYLNSFVLTPGLSHITRRKVTSPNVNASHTMRYNLKPGRTLQQSTSQWNASDPECRQKCKTKSVLHTTANNKLITKAQRMQMKVQNQQNQQSATPTKYYAQSENAT